MTLPRFAYITMYYPALGTSRARVVCVQAASALDSARLLWAVHAPTHLAIIAGWDVAGWTWTAEQTETDTETALTR